MRDTCMPIPRKRIQQLETQSRTSGPRGVIRSGARQRLNLDRCVWSFHNLVMMFLVSYSFSGLNCFANAMQPVSWMRSSRERRMRKCIRVRRVLEVGGRDQDRVVFKGNEDTDVNRTGRYYKGFPSVLYNYQTLVSYLRKMAMWSYVLPGMFMYTKPEWKENACIMLAIEHCNSTNCCLAFMWIFLSRRERILLPQLFKSL